MHVGYTTIAFCNGFSVITSRQDLCGLTSKCEHFLYNYFTRLYRLCGFKASGYAIGVVGGVGNLRLYVVIGHDDLARG